MNNKKIKILCIITSGLLNDGITNNILNYYSNMDQKSIRVELLKVKPVDPDTAQKIRNSGLNLVFSDYRKNVVSYIIKTVRLIKQESYDIVHVHGSSAILSIDLLAAWLGGCKIRIAHSRNTTCSHKITDKILRPVFYQLCNVRFACGESAGRWLFGNRPFTIIKNAKNLEIFSFNESVRSQIRSEYHWNGKCVFGHAGRFNDQKNHHFLIRIFAEIIQHYPESVLVLMGTGKLFEDTKELVHYLGLQDKVFFLGSVNNMPEMLQAMDIMLFPSLFEGLPNVVIEWQCTGLPAVISDTITKECAVTDLVRFVPIDQGTEPWVNAVGQLMNQDETVSREKRSAEAIKKLRAAGYDIKESAPQLKALYMGLVK